MSNLTEEEKEQIGSEIDNQGLGYWVMEYGDFDGDDEVLRGLISKAQESMRLLRTYLEENEIMF